MTGDERLVEAARAVMAEMKGLSTSEAVEVFGLDMATALVRLGDALTVYNDGPECESGWTGDRCRRPLGHDGPHDNE